jgi:hypothetical protein
MPAVWALCQSYGLYARVMGFMPPEFRSQIGLQSMKENVLQILNKSDCMNDLNYAYVLSMLIMLSP